MKIEIACQFFVSLKRIKQSLAKSTLIICSITVNIDSMSIEVVVFGDLESIWPLQFVSLIKCVTKVCTVKLNP